MQPHDVLEARYAELDTREEHVQAKPLLFSGLFVPDAGVPLLLPRPSTEFLFVFKGLRYRL